MAAASAGSRKSGLVRDSTSRRVPEEIEQVTRLPACLPACLPENAG